MNLNQSPTEVVIQLLKRSKCAVQVAAVLADGWGIFSWGWNSSGPDGLGQHAEIHCMRRANPNRIPNATMYVAARRKKNGKSVTAMPCDECEKVVNYCYRVMFRSSKNVWA